MFRTLCAAVFSVALAGTAWAQATSSDPAPAGNYKLDLAHGRLIFQINHVGFSNYTAFFKTFDATLAFDPAAPESMVLQATVDAGSVETLYPDPGFDFNAMIAGADFLDAATYPQMAYKSTAIKLTGEKTAEVTGDLTLHGVTKPVALDVVFNGGYAGHPMDAGARIGFSARGVLKRSDFGISYGIPAPGTTLGVGDEVTIIIEAEFINPDAPKVTE